MPCYTTGIKSERQLGYDEGFAAGMAMAYEVAENNKRRDYFAKAALTGLLSNSNYVTSESSKAEAHFSLNDSNDIAELVVEMADALIAALDKQQGEKID